MNENCRENIRMPQMSVAICTYNRADILKQTLQGLCDQDVPPGIFEILVVDNASTDDTCSVVESFNTAPIAVRYVYEACQGLSHARNRALREVESPIIAYLDDDTIPEPQWVAAHLEMYESIHPRPAVVGGPVLLRWHNEKPEWIQPEFLWVYSYLEHGKIAEPVDSVFGGNMSYQADILRQYQGFDARLGRHLNEQLLSEETVLQDQMRQDGHIIYYQPRAVVWHVIGKERQRPEFLIRRYHGAGRTQAILRFRDCSPSRYVMLNILLRQVYYHRKVLTLLLLYFLSYRSSLYQSDYLLLRCKFATFCGYEYELLRMLFSRQSNELGAATG